ncbi:MAG TPA: Dabb family protein [Phycisphaerae bacterium]|nr:Dabb family protein [Phycisphaerae bacterium]
MIRCLLMCLMSLFVFTGCASTHVENREQPRASVCPKDNPVLRHVVLFAFKGGTTPVQVKSVEDAFRSLPAKIKAICDFEWGTDVSPEGRAEGFTHCFFLTFSNEADRDAYLVHPDHKEFGEVLRPHLEKVLVVDYWSTR